MKLSPNQVGEVFLSQLGNEAVALLKQGDFRVLADRFGYALAFDRDPASAIEEELNACVAEFQAKRMDTAPFQPSIAVKYFKPNETNLFAVVECVFVGPQSCPVLAELFVIANGKEKYVGLEQVSLAA
jgi:hypothetical protein